jgi:uncharacterized protein
MKPSTAFEHHRDTIRRIVSEHRAANPRVFGSVARGDDVETSDIDILVEPAPDASLLDIAQIQVEIEKCLGVPVDVVTPNGLPEKIRLQVLREALPV